MKKKILIVSVLLLGGLAIYLFLSFTQILDRNNNPIAKVNIIEEGEQIDYPRLSIIADNLIVPWAIEFLPDKRILVTERGGNIKLVNGDSVETITTIDVVSISESGLHGIVIDPDFEDNNYVYVYYTTGSNGEETINKVSRFSFNNDSLQDETVILDNIPGASRHDGGRIKFGPDGYLYIATGDAIEPSLSQDRDSLGGKILRINKDGSIPNDNPFGNATYSYGHRNPQGITWDDENNLYNTEHGNSATDEFNKVDMGGNYGWPLITGDQSRSGLVSPLLQSGNSTWAPGGLAFVNDKFYFGGLRGNALYEIEEIGGEYTLTKHFEGEFGRIREVIKGPDDMLYITTSNRDGRGIPSSDDDKIIRINPEKL